MPKKIKKNNNSLESVEALTDKFEEIKVRFTRENDDVLQLSDQIKEAMDWLRSICKSLEMTKDLIGIDRNVERSFYLQSVGALMIQLEKLGLITIVKNPKVTYPKPLNDYKKEKKAGKA